MRQNRYLNSAAVLSASVGLILPPQALALTSLSGESLPKRTSESTVSSPTPGTIEAFEWAVEEYRSEYASARNSLAQKERLVSDESTRNYRDRSEERVAVDSVIGRTDQYQSLVSSSDVALTELGAGITAVAARTDSAAIDLNQAWSSQADNVLAYAQFEVDVCLRGQNFNEERFRREAARYYKSEQIDFEVLRYRMILLADALFAPSPGMNAEVAASFKAANERIKEECLKAEYSAELTSQMSNATANLKGFITSAAVYKRDPGVLEIAKKVLEGTKTVSEFVGCIHEAAGMCFAARQAHIQRENNASIRILTAPTIEEALAINADMDKKTTEMNAFCKEQFKTCVDDAKRDFYAAQRDLSSYKTERYCDDYSSIRDRFESRHVREGNDTMCDRMSSESCHDYSKDTCRDTSSSMDSGGGGFSDDYSSLFD